jgi:hypothetical protein
MPSGQRRQAICARGVPRVLSGVQSIISFYLVAMALLAYFGRPFQ